MRKQKKIKIICCILLGVAVLVLGYSTYIYFANKNKKDNNDEIVDNAKNEEKRVQIINLESNTRPYAVMINNLNEARPYQSGLQDAYIVYEIIVEGGITRMMALFKDATTERIGSVRSARHYYLDYAVENDAIYAHYGWSPQAQSDMSTLGVNNINGLYDAAYWREDTLPIDYEHTAFTSIAKLKSVAEQKGYRMKTTTDSLLNYTVNEVDLSKNDASSSTNKVDIKYSNYITTTYKYNTDEKVYYRSVNEKLHTDYVTKKQYTAKNIIVAFISNDDMNDLKGRQNLNNIGTGDGYYITDGYSVPITWTKSTRKSQTVYKYKDGKEIEVNDGNTFIQIAPLKSLTITE